MTIPTLLARFIGVVALPVAWGFVRMVLGWLDMRIGAPIMKERINEGSDKYFEFAGKHWGESEIDSIIHSDFDAVSETREVGIRFPTPPPRSESSKSAPTGRSSDPA
ncbi:MAG: hypothetical protein QOD47_549 [Gemmatimonadaceae bacterium]|nr:hypothetical protein [Gemmatimonadaceae bacterium]